MSKQLFVDPSALRKPGKVHFKDIPLNTYQKAVKDEVGNLSKQQLRDIYRDMLMLREFETMLNLIKTTGEYKGIAYNHPGPAHLSMGQEASAVGMAFHLDENDYIFGSHRSHGEILAKGLSAIEKLSDDALLDIMKGFFGGEILKVVETGKHDTVKAMAIDFLLYGAMAEIFARVTGFNRGLGGSMHTFFTPFGIYPTTRAGGRLGRHRYGRGAV
jgi:2-oxoisovalerate dehydrogenase E1 component